MAKKRLVIEVHDKLHKQIKVLAAQQKKSIKDLVLEIVGIHLITTQHPD